MGQGSAGFNADDGGDDLDWDAVFLFGPFQVVVTWGDGDLDKVLDVLERMSQHLTAAVVSADPVFQTKVLGDTVNGTTYCGMRARTTGAPQNHWFGPCGDPRGAGHRRDRPRRQAIPGTGHQLFNKDMKKATISVSVLTVMSGWL